MRICLSFLSTAVSAAILLAGGGAGCEKDNAATEPAAVSACEEQSYDCESPLFLSCRVPDDCLCLFDECAEQLGGLETPIVDCCNGFCVSFAETDLESCEDLAGVAPNCPVTGSAFPECGFSVDCEGLVDASGFFQCESGCCVTRLPATAGEGEACVEDPFAEPQCDFGLDCVDGACLKICPDDSLGEPVFTCEQVAWFGPEATCESFEFGPCDETTGCCGLPDGAVSACDPFPSCGEVGGDCASMGLEGDCLLAEDCCQPPPCFPYPACGDPFVSMDCVGAGFSGVCGDPSDCCGPPP